MSNRPVYRYPPKSHAYNCPCPRYVQCRTTGRAGDDLMKFDFGCLGVLLACAAVSAVCGWIVKNGHAILHNLPFIAAPPAILAVTVWAVVYLNKRALRPPKGRLKVEAGPQPFTPPPLICAHPNAVRVENMLDPKLTWHCWCPDCDPEGKTPLPASFRLPCCGAAPGTQPGTGHLYNCPYKGTP